MGSSVKPPDPEIVGAAAAEKDRKRGRSRAGWERMEAPRYVREEEELAALPRQVKGWRCPHCRRAGYLNGHGVLRGLSADGRSKAAERGRRFFCSDRGRREGCGHTFSVHWQQVIAETTVRSAGLWRFYCGRFAGGSVVAAWAALRSGFSVEAACRWWRRSESTLRTVLARGRDPPLEALLRVLTEVYGAADPIGGFQYQEQRGWP